MAEMKETKKRGAKKIQYQVVARYMDGNEVTGYHLQSINSDKSKRYTKEQTLLIAAKGQITNAVAIITNTGATLSGKNGIKIANLPVVQEQDGKAVLTNSDSLGKVNRNLSIEEAINMFKLTYVIKDGKKKVGYTIQNSGGAEKDITRAETIELAKQNKLGNAFINMCKGVALLRGKGGFKLDDLPVKDISESTLAGATKPEQKVETNSSETKNDNKYFKFEFDFILRNSDYIVSQLVDKFKHKLDGIPSYEKYKGLNNFEDLVKSLTTDRLAINNIPIVELTKHKNEVKSVTVNYLLSIANTKNCYYLIKYNVDLKLGLSDTNEERELKENEFRYYDNVITEAYIVIDNKVDMIDYCHLTDAIINNKDKTIEEHMLELNKIDGIIYGFKHSLAYATELIEKSLGQIDLWGRVSNDVFKNTSIDCLVDIIKSEYLTDTMQSFNVTNLTYNNHLYDTFNNFYKTSIRLEDKIYTTAYKNDAKIPNNTKVIASININKIFKLPFEDRIVNTELYKLMNNQSWYILASDGTGKYDKEKVVKIDIIPSDSTIETYSKCYNVGVWKFTECGNYDSMCALDSHVTTVEGLFDRSILTENSNSNCSILHEKLCYNEICHAVNEIVEYNNGSKHIKMIYNDITYTIIQLLEILYTAYMKLAIIDTFYSVVNKYNNIYNKATDIANVIMHKDSDDVLECKIIYERLEDYVKVAYDGTIINETAVVIKGNENNNCRLYKEGIILSIRKGNNINTINLETCEHSGNEANKFIDNFRNNVDSAIKSTLDDMCNLGNGYDSSYKDLYNLSKQLQQVAIQIMSGSQSKKLKLLERFNYYGGDLSTEYRYIYYFSEENITNENDLVNSELVSQIAFILKPRSLQSNGFFCKIEITALTETFNPEFRSSEWIVNDEYESIKFEDIPKKVKGYLKSFSSRYENKLGDLQASADRQSGLILLSSTKKRLESIENLRDKNSFSYMGVYGKLDKKHLELLSDITLYKIIGDSSRKSDTIYKSVNTGLVQVKVGDDEQALLYQIKYEDNKISFKLKMKYGNEEHKIAVKFNEHSVDLLYASEAIYSKYMELHYSLVR